ncbi:MAG: hypothetical protein ABIE36_03175 [Candidatus Diapherotrites archaeon]
MKEIKVGLKFKRKKIKISGVKKLRGFEKGIGLMFRSCKKCPAMLFEFRKPTRMRIHSLFVFFKFAAVWTDDKNRVIDLKIVKPFQFIVFCKRPFYNLIEIPLNKRYQKEIKFLFGKK